MYVPNHFAETRLDVLHQAIDELAFGSLVHLSDAGLEANPLPFELDRRGGSNGTLRCHVARSNRVWQDVSESSLESLIIFQGPSAYISPSLYPAKQETHEVVPTYNYLTIHAYGRVVVHDDEKWVRGIVGRLTRKFEANRDEPWKMGDAPQEYLHTMLQKIVGLEIPISRLVGKWKLNQNRPENDRRGVIQHLNASPTEADRAVAALMQAYQREE